jgi:hypothetical protein
MVAAGGEVAVAFEGNVFDHAPQLRRDLKSVHEFCGAPPANPCYVTPLARKAMSASVLASLASNGNGFVTDSGRRARPPEKADEVRSVTAFAEILEGLDGNRSLVGKPGEVSRSVAGLDKSAAARQGTDSFAKHSDELGLRVLEWLRHTDAHVFYATRLAEKGGLTTDVVSAAVQAAITALVEAQPGSFARDSSGALVRAAGTETT